MFDLSGHRIALVGGAGFIGHNAAVAMAKAGADVHVVDGLQVNNLLSHISMEENSNRELYLRIINQRFEKLQKAGVPLHVQDARDYHAVSHLLTEIKPTTIVHLAAVAHASRSNKDPYSTFDHSLRTLENTLDYSRGRGVERFVYFSSSMVYGNFNEPEISEDHPLDPIGIYGALKLAGEHLVNGYNQVFDLPYTIVRPSALYGPGCVSRRVSQAFIESALVGRELRVDGEGDERIDFSYIDDVVDGLCRVVGSPNGANQIFNLTAGQARTLSELVELVKEHFPEVQIKYVERDKLRPFRGTLGIEKARRLLGYEPKIQLEEGLDRYVAWYRELTSDGLLAPVGAGS